MLHWPNDVLGAVADCGFAVARFDNRDTGLSTQFSTAGVPNLFTRLTRPTAAAGYRLKDIADDGISVLDALRWDSTRGRSADGYAGRPIVIYPSRLAYGATWWPVTRILGVPMGAA